MIDVEVEAAHTEWQTIITAAGRDPIVLRRVEDAVREVLGMPKPLLMTRTRHRWDDIITVLQGDPRPAAELVPLFLAAYLGRDAA